MKQFLDHNYPGGKWTKARKTHLVCKIDGNDVLIIITTNYWKKRTEEILLNKIKQNKNQKQLWFRADLSR